MLPEPVIERTSVFAVDPLNLFKLGGGGVGFIALTVMVAMQRHSDFLVTALMAVTAIVLLTLCALRWKERVEIDAQSIRLSSPLGGFTVAWADLDSVMARKDSLGPYEVRLIVRTGASRKLRRIYADWDQLIEELLEHAGVTG